MSVLVIHLLVGSPIFENFVQTFSTPAVVRQVHFRYFSLYNSLLLENLWQQLHCVPKHPNIFDCNLKTSQQILIIFGANISDTTCHQMTIQFLTSPNVCFCITWRKHNQRNITFYPMQHDCLINITCKTHFVHISNTLADISSSCPFFNCLQ